MTIRDYLTSEDTESAFRFVVGAATPLIVCTWLGYNEAGIFLLLGATFVFGLDVPIALPKKLGLMLFTGLLSAFIFVVFTQIIAYPVWNGLLLFGFLFVLNFLSPFSPNFGTVALLLNLSVMIGLSMAESVPTWDNAFYKAGLLLLGAGWYTVYAMMLHPLQRPRQLRRRLQNCLQLTANYLSSQSSLFETSIYGPDALLELSQKQGEVTEMHQQIREVLLREPGNLTNPETFMGRATYLLAHLVDMSELATAASLSLQAVSGSAESEKAKPYLQEINRYVEHQLRVMSSRLEQNEPLPTDETLKNEIDRALKNLNEYLDTLKTQTVGQQQAGEVYRQLRRLQRYAEQQVRLLHAMVSLLDDNSNASLDLAPDRIRQFAIYDVVEWNYLKSHISFQSGFFKYALRMALTAVGAYYLAGILGLDNPSWALLTVLVILKPGFHLSRQRLIHRVAGTLLGTAAGLLLYYGIDPEPAAAMGIFLGSLFFAFSFIKRQYGVTTFFFTLFILFFYSYLQREFMDAAYFRLLDTLLAGALCWLAIRYVFPYWEVQNLPQVASQAIRANRDLFRQVLDDLESDERTITAYKLYRKEAFLKLDELLGSYRQVQAESPAQADALNNIQRLSLLIYTQLSLITSLGLFLKRQPGYHCQDMAVHKRLREALEGMNIMAASPDKVLDSEEPFAHDHIQELTERRREIEHLIRIRSDSYFSRVHDLFWIEAAYELMEGTRKISKQVRRLVKKTQ